MNIIDRIFHLFTVAGNGAYFGEAVTETQHALQSAHLANAAGADEELITATLLHDVGHLLHGLGEHIADQGIDSRHEEGGAGWLEQHFGPAVSEPVRLHVAAKRYLCAVDPGYLAGLSAASRRSLHLQGGPLDLAAVREFELGPHFKAAVALRRWDDGAKVAGLDVPELEHYRDCLEVALARERPFMTTSYDVAVVGAGVLGMAHAYHLAKRGLRVVVFERQPRAQGASVRNFGMLWPIGQPAGSLHRLARRSLEIWLEILGKSGIWHERTGSLHLAYHDDEAAVLREFVAAQQAERPCELLTAAQLASRFPVIISRGLHAGLWSPTEVAVDPRQVIGELPAWLNHTYGVDFVFNTPVIGYDTPRIETANGNWSAPRLVVCTGKDFRELAADAFAASGLVPCKLQMMRSQPYGPEYRVGTMLAAGLTLRHYRSFADCPSLPALSQRIDAEVPEFRRYGIHVLLAQNGRGELVIGDSHEYGDAIEPFDNPLIDNNILAYLQTFVAPPNLCIAARWHGVYIKHPTEPFVTAQPQSGMLVVTGVGGAGMTLSFGLAEQTIATWLGEKG